MKIYTSHSSSIDYANDLYEPLTTEFGTGHELILPHENNEEGFNTREVLPTCDMVLAEVSQASTGQGIELGWASAAGVPIIAFYKKGSNRSSALQYVAQDLFEYETLDDMIAGIRHCMNTTT